MIPWIATRDQLDIAEFYWELPWWGLSREMVEEALDWFYE